MTVRKKLFLTKIISGGQTGVDQAALRAAVDCGLKTGGWCPPGCRSEEGPVPVLFGLQETPHDVSPGLEDIPRSQRTHWNVRDSDVTVVFNPDHCDDNGTAATLRVADDLGKPLFMITRTREKNTSEFISWLQSQEAEILNVAGPSESVCPGIGRRAYAFMSIVFKTCMT